MPPSTTLAPLLTRPGARFACAGDGLCCTDIHLLGPLTLREAAPFRAALPETLVRRSGLVLLRTTEQGRCAFLQHDARCGLHDARGPLQKPRSCHRYPFLLVATPDGGRVGTDHRCPCRTLGERPTLRAEDARAALEDGRGRLSVDRRSPARIPLAPGQRVGWARYRELEDTLLARLAAGSVDDVLDAAPFPPLDGYAWPQLAEDLALDLPDSRWGEAHRWFAVFLGVALGLPADTASLRRPWTEAFDRAERRARTPLDPRSMEADFVADALWALEWIERGTWAHARVELRTRLEIARHLAAFLEARGARADRAMAEALAVIEVAGVSDAWSAVVARMAPARRTPAPRRAPRVSR